MSTITKERIELFIKNPLENGLTRSEQMEVARIALASLEAKPIGAFHIADQRVDGTSDYIKDGEWPIDDGVIEVYAAPPAPVSVPYLLEQFAEFMAAESIKSGDYPDGWQCKASNAAHEYAQNIRAAMLQGAEQQNRQQNIPENIPATQFKPVADLYGLTSPTGSETSFTFDAVEARDFIDGGWSCQEYVELERFQEAVSGNSPVIQGCSCLTCRPVTFSDSRFVVCPECGNKRCPHANDHRNACTGSNEPGQEGSAYPAAPQQEVK